MNCLKIYLDPPESKAKCPYGYAFDEDEPDNYTCLVRSAISGGMILSCNESKCPFGDE